MLTYQTKVKFREAMGALYNERVQEENENPLILIAEFALEYLIKEKTPQTTGEAIATIQELLNEYEEMGWEPETPSSQYFR